MAKQNTISVRVHIALNELESILYSANQGTRYWRDAMDERDSLYMLDYEKDMTAFMLNKQRILIVDAEEDNKVHTLDFARIKKGLTAMAKHENRHFTDIMQGNSDMYTADALIQCALFGKIIYS